MILSTHRGFIRMIIWIIAGAGLFVAQVAPLQGQVWVTSAIEATIVRGDEFATYTMKSATGHLFILKTIKNTCCVVTYSPAVKPLTFYMPQGAVTGLENMKTAGFIPANGTRATALTGQSLLRHKEPDMAAGIALVIHYN